jgi:hypothetical protein
LTISSRPQNDAAYLSSKDDDDDDDDDYSSANPEQVHFETG